MQKHRTEWMMVFMSKLSRLMSKYGDVCRPSACPRPRGQRAQDVGVELKMLVLSLSGFLHVTSCFCSTINLPVLDSLESFEIVFEFGCDSFVLIVNFFLLAMFAFLINPQKYRLDNSSSIFLISFSMVLKLLLISLLLQKIERNLC